MSFVWKTYRLSPDGDMNKIIDDEGNYKRPTNALLSRFHRMIRRSGVTQDFKGWKARIKRQDEESKIQQERIGKTRKSSEVTKSGCSKSE